MRETLMKSYDNLKRIIQRITRIQNVPPTDVSSDSGANMFGMSHTLRQSCTISLATKTSESSQKNKKKREKKLELLGKKKKKDSRKTAVSRLCMLTG